MKIKPFKLEQYFAKYEFSAKYLLSSSDCDGLPLEYVLDCADASQLELWNGLRLGYTESKGLPLLRETIARQYKTIDAEEVLVLSPGEANFILMNVALDKGDQVICMSPIYQSLYQVAESVGCNISYWKPDTSNWHYAIEDLRALITNKTRALILNFPHNPTGFIPTKAELDEIVALARMNNLLIFSDEMYFDLVHDSGNNIPAMCDLYENAISLWGMAKSFGLAGLRIGWVASKNKKLLQDMLDYKDYLTICNNAMSEILSIIALTHRDKFITPNVEKIKRNIELFASFVSTHNNLIDFSRPVAGSTAFIKLNLKEGSLAYCDRLANEAGIMLLPSEMFDFDSRHARIGFGRKSMPEALEAWGRYINKNL